MKASTANARDSDARQLNPEDWTGHRYLAIRDVPGETHRDQPDLPLYPASRVRGEGEGNPRSRETATRPEARTNTGCGTSCAQSDPGRVGLENAGQRALCRRRARAATHYHFRYELKNPMFIVPQNYVLEILLRKGMRQSVYHNSDQKFLKENPTHVGILLRKGIRRSVHHNSKIKSL